MQLYTSEIPILDTIHTFSIKNKNEILIIWYTFINQFGANITRARASKYEIKNLVQRIMNLIFPSKGSQSIPFPSIMMKKILLGAFKKFLKKSLRQVITITTAPSGETRIKFSTKKLCILQNATNSWQVLPRHYQNMMWAHL